MHKIYFSILYFYGKIIKKCIKFDKMLEFEYMLWYHNYIKNGKIIRRKNFNIGREFYGK